jgi:hypothetical protein
MEPLTMQACFQAAKSDNITKHHSIKGKEDAKLTETQSNNKRLFGQSDKRVHCTALLWYFLFGWRAGWRGIQY